MNLFFVCTKENKINIKIKQKYKSDAISKVPAQWMKVCKSVRIWCRFPKCYRKNPIIPTELESIN